MMTYIEPYRWYSSPMSSTMYFSNDSKLQVTCPTLSSSLASPSSLISNNESIPIGTVSTLPSSLFRRIEENISTFTLRSVVSQTDDYYANKRIEELHERMDDIQTSNFLKFINYHLSLKTNNKKFYANDLSKDLSDGHILIDLLEVLSSKKLKREHGRTRFHSLANVQYVLDYLKSRIQHVNISPHDIVSGNRKQILALLWIIMKLFNFPAFHITNKNCLVENTLLGFGQDRSTIIQWLNNILNQSLHTQQIYIKDFYIKTWYNSYYLSKIIQYLIPLSQKYLTIKCFDYLKQLDESTIYDQAHFQLCLNLSNYGFNTIKIIDFKDKTEKSLFKYFTELQKNIFIILKTNKIGKLIQINPYTKQILNTIVQTRTEHIINNNEEYLSCINEYMSITKQKSSPLDSTSLSYDANPSRDLGILDKSNLSHYEQQEERLKQENQWTKNEDLRGNFHLENSSNVTLKDKQDEIITNELQRSNATAEKSEQSILSTNNITNNYVKSHHSIISNQDFEPCRSIIKQRSIVNDEEREMIITNVKNQLNGKLEQIVVSQEDVNQSSENELSSIEMKQSNIGIGSSEPTASTSSEHISSINTNNELETSFNEVEVTQQLRTQSKLFTSTCTDESLRQPTLDLRSSNGLLNEKAILTSIENNPTIVKSKRLEKPIVIESPQPISISNGIDNLTHENFELVSDSLVNQLSYQENQPDILSNEQLKQSTVEINEPDSIEPAAIIKFLPAAYSNIVPTDLSQTSNESEQTRDLFEKKQSHLKGSKKNKTSSIITMEKCQQDFKIVEEDKQIPFKNTNKESEQLSLFDEKSINNTENACISSISNLQRSKCSTKTNKSTRSNPKKGKLSVKTEISSKSIVNQDEEEVEQPLLPSDICKSINSKQPSNHIESTDNKSSTTSQIPFNDNTSTDRKNLNRLQYRKSSEKAKISPTVTTATVEKRSSPDILPTTTNRNLLVVLREHFRMWIKVFLFNYSFKQLTTYRWLSKTHKPHLFESKWVSIFAEAATNSYLPSSSINNNKPFVMLFPPPNVTGTVHLGHALTAFVHDCLLRWHTMQQKSYVRCVPGFDHAGIATQVIVEKHIAPQTRQQIGREKFVEECYRWSSNYRQTIETQLQRLCPLFDWSNAYFTMDEDLAQYIRDSFLHLYNEGLIYRDRRIVNWCCRLQSVVSDIEVDSKEINGRQKFAIPGYSKDIELGVLYNIAYNINDEEQDKEIIVSTTRPETILADTGVAVHPLDSRYKSLKDKFVQNPFNPHDRLPVVFDENVNQNFGTGAVKLTPGHDAFDYALAIKHKLPIRTMLNDHGYVQLHPSHPFYQELNDLHRYDAREKVLQLLESQGLRRGEQEQEKMILPLCSRTGDIIEPMVKEQWFLDTSEMSRQVSSIVDDNTLKLTPSSIHKVWKYWLDNNRPWCLSRQLWWGHSIPMYRCSINDQSSDYRWIGAKSIDEARTKAKQLFSNVPLNSIHIEQDQDVLDTWFSSGLLPILIFNNKDSKEFPTTLLETGYDIMFFWVARMVMLSLKLTNRIPFREVLFHGLVCDPNGKKMSKSLGNIIDPMDVVNGISLQSLQARLEQSHLSRSEIERAKRAQAVQYPSGIEPIGSDGLRLCLLSYDISQQSIRLDPTQFNYVGRYCNKVWNAYKYVTEYALVDMNFRNESLSNMTYEQVEKLVEDRLVDRWILHELNETIGKVNHHFNNYTFHLAIVRLRDSFIKDFCDFYIEFSKIPIKKQSNNNMKSNVQILLYYLLKQYLILYHPFLPAMTEELWHDFTHGKQGYLIHQLYPTMKNITSIDPMDDQVIQIIRLILKNSTYFKQMLRLSHDSDIIIHCYNHNQENLSIHLENYLTEIRTITRLHKVHVCNSLSTNNSLNVSKFSFRDYITDNIELVFNLKDDKQTKELVDKHEERLSKQVDKLRDDLNVNETTIKFYQENNNLEYMEREQHRREILMQDIKVTQRRHERFVKLAQKRTIIEKVNSKKTKLS